MAIGVRTLPARAPSLLAAARKDARQLGALLAAARRIASSITTGRHPQQRYGPGENFWQFRPYLNGEPAMHIDWRRSARDNHIYIRDREKQVAQTICLCPDLSPSMQYRSRTAHHSKEERALLLTLVLADIFCRNGERITIPGLLPPTSARNGAERAALALAHAGEKNSWLDTSAMGRHADVVIISDFLLSDTEIDRMALSLAERNARACLIEVADPAEAEFPFHGRITFHDPEDGHTLTAGKAQRLAKEYRRLHQARRGHLAALCQSRQWHFCLSMTDRPLSETLYPVITALETGADGRRGLR